MKTIHTLPILTCALLTLFIGSAVAQPIPPTSDKKSKTSAAEKLVKKIEEKTGKALTEQQKTQISEAARAFAKSKRDSADQYRSAVESATGLAAKQKSGPAGEGQKPNPTPGEAKVKGPSDPIAKLEAKLGRPLTTEEKGKIESAATARKAADDSAHQTFVQAIATATGLSTDEASQIVPKKEQGQHGPRPKKESAQWNFSC